MSTIRISKTEIVDQKHQNHITVIFEWDKCDGYRTVLNVAPLVTKLNPEDADEEYYSSDKIFNHSAPCIATAVKKHFKLVSKWTANPEMIL